MNIKLINELFDNGYIPNCFYYTIEPKIMIDPEKITYNEYYKSNKYFEQKFKGSHVIPGFDKVIELFSEKATTPLEEIEKRQIIKSS